MPHLDPATLVLIGAFHLLAFGAMGFAFGGRSSAGVRTISAALAGFGLAIFLRFATGPASIALGTAWVDLAMVLSALLLLRGLRVHAHRPGPDLPASTIALAAFFAAHLLLVPRFGQIARILLLSGTTGAIFLFAGAGLLGEIRRDESPVRRPLVLLCVLLLGLGSGTLARCLYLVVISSGRPYADPVAVAFYVYLSLSITLLPLGLLWMFFARTHHELERVAGRDFLTDSLNRNGLEDTVRRHFDGEASRSLVLLQVDVDHFKRINDTCGHETGDRVLRAVAQALHLDLRAEDFVARVGGEEFLVGCVMNQQSGAAVIAERLRSRVEQLALHTPDGRPVSCTISVGVSRPIVRREEWETAAGDADRALYAAKNAGRNCVRLASLPGAASTADAEAIPAT